MRSALLLAEVQASNPWGLIQGNNKGQRAHPRRGGRDIPGELFEQGTDSEGGVPQSPLWMGRYLTTLVRLASDTSVEK